MNNKYFLIFFSLLIALSFFPLGVSANNLYSYYRTDVDNGSWNSFQTGLTSTFYQDETTGQTTYNRDFETDFSVVGGACENGWCNTDGSSVFARTSDDSYSGTYSGRIINPSGAGALITAPVEIVTDSNISLWYKCVGAGCGGVASFGYVNDENTYRSVVNMSAVADWTYVTYSVPDTSVDSTRGNIRFAFLGNPSGTNTVYIDDLRVIKNNAGTFRVNTAPEYCSSISSCSNISQHLPGSSLGALYYVVDYVPGAVCGYKIGQPASTFAKTGSGSGFTDINGYMTEGLSGMYYFEVNKPIDVNDYVDLNIEVYCLKAPTQKGFFTTARLYKYGVVENGNFDSTIDVYNGECENGWCNTDGSTHFTTTTANAQDGENSGRILLPSGVGAYIFSENTDVSGETVSFYWKCGGAGCPASSWGYVNDSNVYTGVANMSQVSTWQYATYNVPSGSYRFSIFGDSGSANIYIDNVTYSGAKKESSLSVSNTLVNNYGIRGTTYTFSSDYKNVYGNEILGADCNISINSVDHTADYNSSTGVYSYSAVFVSDGTYTVEHSCASDDFTDQSASYNIEIVTPASTTVTFTPIQNISSYSLSNFSNRLDFSIGNNQDEVIYSIYSQEDYSPDFYFNTYKDNIQYGVYTSSDGSNWVFNESLTYGYSSSFNDPVQKIPLGNSIYESSFSTSLESGVISYYKLKPYTVPLYYQTINNSLDWISYNKPTLYEDGNNVNWDLFQDSNYTNIRSESLRYIPELTSSDLNAGFEFQFTAFASTSTNIEIGYTYNGTDVTETVPITTGKVTYSVPILPTDYDSKLLIKSDSSSSARVYITNYALIPKAYFMDRLNIYDASGDNLTAILYGGESDLYVREGYPLIVQTSAYDRDGDLQTLRLEALIGSTVVRTYDFDLSEATEEDNLFTWRESVEAIIDLNGYYGNPAGFRSATFRATLINTAGQEVSEQFKTVRLMQYPYFDDDISLYVAPLTNKVGENPKFRLRLNQELPEMFIGFHISLWDEDSSFANPDYETYIYKDSFNCSFECIKDIVLDEFVYEKEDVYNINFTILLSTENEVTDNDLTSKTYGYYVSYKVYETARIFQTFERSDLTYRNDEPMPVVLQIRDVPYIDLKDRTSVYLTVDLCPSDTGGCDTNGSTKFLPKFHYYDETTGYNYFYWNNIFFTDSGDLLYDGNYLRFQAHISDKYYAHDTTVIPEATLGGKCADVGFTDIGSFLYNFLASAVTGCTTPASSVIELGDAEEQRLIIDADHNVSGVPNQSLFCVKPNNEVYRDTLKQDLYCGVVYKRSEMPIDNFNIIIGNEFSDYTKTGAEKQFIDFTIPAEDVIFNDPYLMQEALNSEYSTDSIDTLGEFIYYGLDSIFTGVANPVSEIPTALTDSGFITNVNWDLNFDGLLDPTFVTGFFYIKIEGFEVENQYNYIDMFEELETLNPANFRTFAIRNNIPLPKKDTIVTVYASDMEQVEKLKVDSPLVIYAKPSVANVDPNALDENVARAVIPSTLKFSFISDMIFNSGKNYDRIHVPLILSQVITQPVSLQGFINWFGDAFSNPVDWFSQNWFIIIVLIIFVLIVSLVYANFRGGGGVNVFNAPPNINIKRR